MELFKLEKPDFKSVDPSEVFKKYLENLDHYQNLIERVNQPKYLYWDKVKHLPTPKGLNHVEFWWLVKQLRKLNSKNTAIKAEDEKKFTWVRLGYTDEYLHKIDTHTGGQIFVPYQVLSEQIKQKFVGRGIIEEAIASSQLEGAHTTRAAARKLILEKKSPKNKSEMMILNNYITMRMLDEEYKDRKLSRDLIFELHASLTKGTVPSNEQYRFRKDNDRVKVEGTEKIFFIPPKSSFLKPEISRLIEYANDENAERFVHPVIKAIFLHFWIGYLHPFTDGNGRLARSLFYWYLLRKGYWTMMYLPISSVIKKSPVQYGMAYVYSEQDSLDLTYFYDYHMRKILQAIEEFTSYLGKTILENKEIERALAKELELNDRQKQIIHYLLSEGEDSYTTTIAHATLNNVSRLTAGNDLKHLESKGYLDSKKVGRYVRYYATDKLANVGKEVKHLDR